MSVIVSPGARTSAVVGLHGQELRVRVAARAIDGSANRETIAFLARHLGVPPSQVRVLRGLVSRHKVIEIDGLTEEEALKRLLR